LKQWDYHKKKENKMENQKQALVIKTTGEFEVVSFTAKTEYEVIKKAVGGYLEIIRLSPSMTMWTNEEGKLDGLPVNHRATALWTYYFGATDIIVGNVILTGGTDTDGNCLGLSLADGNKAQTIALSTRQEKGETK
jgi:hypothetical protein